VLPSLLQNIGNFIVLRPSDFGIDSEVTYLVVGWRPTTATFYSFDDGIKIVERYVPTLTLCSHSDTEITSRPLSIRVFYQADLSVRRVHIAGVCS